MALEEKTVETVGVGSLGAGLGAAVLTKGLGGFESPAVHGSLEYAASNLGAGHALGLGNYFSSVSAFYNPITQIFGLGSGIGLGLAKSKGEYTASGVALGLTALYSLYQYATNIGVPLAYGFTSWFSSSLILGAIASVGIYAAVGFLAGRALRTIFRRKWGKSKK